MRRGDRLFELIEVLRSARAPISAERIGETLGVSKRTVYRDVATLIGQRVPIRGEPSVGYVLEPGFHLPPLMLTQDEIEAALLGAQWVQTRAEPELATAAQRLLAKIAAVVPEQSALSFVEPTTSVAPVQEMAEVLSSSDVRQCIRRRQKIQISYRAGSGDVTQRVIWPILLGYRDVGRIIAAWCELRAGFRYFRTERIAEANVLEDRIPERMDILRARWRAAMDMERQEILERQARGQRSGD